MSKIKEFIKKFSPAEVVVVVGSIFVSLALLISGLTTKKEEKPKLLVYLYPNEKAINIEGAEISLFASEFALAYEDSDDTTLSKVRSVLDQHLVPLHKLFDRHEYYYADSEKGELLHNLRYLNHHKGEEVEIDYHLYQVLKSGKEFSMKTLSEEEDSTSGFNFFLGKVYDYWEPFFDKLNPAPATDDPLFNEASRTNLERLLSEMPTTVKEVKEALILTEENERYYAKLLPGEYEITLGALGKGYSADVLESELNKQRLTDGLIYGAASTIAFLKDGIFDTPLEISMASIDQNVSPYSFKFSRADRYRIATSGTYEGRKIVSEDKEYLRAHIVDPTTGYTPTHSHQIASIISTNLSSLELDYLTTQLIVMSVSDGQAFLNKYYSNKDINLSYVGKIAEEYYVAFSASYPNGNSPKITLSDGYREKNLEIL